jgi:hypothetical protein
VLNGVPSARHSDWEGGSPTLEFAFDVRLAAWRHIAAKAAVVDGEPAAAGQGRRLARPRQRQALQDAAAREATATAATTRTTTAIAPTKNARDTAAATCKKESDRETRRAPPPKSTSSALTRVQATWYLWSILVGKRYLWSTWWAKVSLVNLVGKGSQGAAKAPACTRQKIVLDESCKQHDGGWGTFKHRWRQSAFKSWTHGFVGVY